METVEGVMEEAERVVAKAAAEMAAVARVVAAMEVAVMEVAATCASTCGPLRRW